MALRTDEIAASGPDLGEGIEDYQLALHAAGQSKNTQAVYTLALTYLERYLFEQGMPRHLSSIRREHIEAWLGAMRGAGKARGDMSPPLVPEKSPAILSGDQLKALLKPCAGARFEDRPAPARLPWATDRRRDHADAPATGSGRGDRQTLPAHVPTPVRVPLAVRNGQRGRSPAARRVALDMALGDDL